AACAIAFGALVDNTFVITLAAYACAFSLFALSINVMLGWLGEVALGQSIFFGVGAYGVGIGMLKLGLSYEMSIVLGLVLSVVLAAGIGALTLKLTGAYFSIVSWGLSGVAVVAATNLESITGGPLGMYGFQRLAIGPFELTHPRTYFFVTATILFLVVLVLRETRDSRFGASLESIRQNRHLAQSVGIDVFRERLKALMLSAPLAALGGALCLPYTQIVTPEIFSVSNTVDALLMVLLGGSGLIVGPIIGAGIFSAIPPFLELDANVRILVFSVAIILIMIFEPGGLHRVGQRLIARWRR
ncbi:MAG: branched-chain amino acid ABC transporter permease, partial [Proteobacteria bacterium]|nr:branched-chain amino acid ABC transporter permease [Pseudomonadota bacterium]